MKKLLWGEKWIEDIISNTVSWTAVEARKYLNLLNSRGVSSESILRVLKSTDYLKGLRAGEISLKLQVADNLSQKSNYKQVIPERHIQAVNQKIKEIAKISHSGSDVFINYVKWHFRDSFEKNKKDGESLDAYVNRQMLISGKSQDSWIDRISKKAQYWNVVNASLFLDFLEKEMQMEPFVIINMFKSAVSFFGTNYTNFKDRVEIYSKYLTIEETRKILENHFSSFQFGIPKNIIHILSFLKGYIGEEDTKTILKGNLKSIALASSKILELNQNIKYLEKYLGKGNLEIGKDKLKDIIRGGGFYGIVLFKVSRNRFGEYENKRVQWLISRGFSQDEIISFMEHHSLAFTLGDLSKIKIDYLENYLGKGDIGKGRIKLNVMIKNRKLIGIVKFQVSQNEAGEYEHTKVRWLTNRNLFQDEIIKLIENNPLAFSSGDLSKAKITYLESYLGNGDIKIGRNKLDGVMKRGGLESIALFRISQNESDIYGSGRIKWLDNRGISQDEIIELIENKIGVFVAGDLSKVKIDYLENYLGKGDINVGKKKLNSIITTGGFVNIARFKGYKNESGELENTGIKWLTNRGFSQDEIIKLIEKNSEILYLEGLSKERTAYLESYLGKGDINKGRVKLNTIITNRGVHIVRFEVYQNEAGQFENERIKWLKDRNLSQDEIIRLIESNPMMFSLGDLSEEKITYLENYLGKGDVEVGKAKLTDIIKNKGLLGFAKFKVYRNEAGQLENIGIKWLEDRHFSPEEIISLLTRNSEFFSQEVLSQEATSYLENYLGKGDVEVGREKLNSIIKTRGLSSISDFKVYKNKSDSYENERIKWLEDRHFSQEEIIQFLEDHTRAFSKGDTFERKITYLENYLGKGDLEVGKVKLNNMVKNGGFYGIVLFKVTRDKTNNYENKKVKLLIEMGYTQDQVIRLMENYLLESFSRDVTEEQLKTYLERLIKKGELSVCKDALT